MEAFLQGKTRKDIPAGYILRSALRSRTGESKPKTCPAVKGSKWVVDQYDAQPFLCADDYVRYIAPKREPTDNQGASNKHHGLPIAISMNPNNNRAAGSRTMVPWGKPSDFGQLYDVRLIFFEWTTGEVFDVTNTDRFVIGRWSQDDPNGPPMVWSSLNLPIKKPSFKINEKPSSLPGGSTKWTVEKCYYQHDDGHRRTLDPRTGQILFNMARGNHESWNYEFDRPGGDQKNYNIAIYYDEAGQPNYAVDLRRDYLPLHDVVSKKGKILEIFPRRPENTDPTSHDRSDVIGKYLAPV